MSEFDYLRPIGLVGQSADPGMAAGHCLPLVGGPLGFTACEASRRGPDGSIERHLIGLGELTDGNDGVALIARLTEARADFAGLAMDRPQVMGVINVTPDSFSDGGDRFDHGRAVADGLAMLEAGASILDVGGESTRPGAEPVPEDEELRRVLPTVRGLAEAGAKVSIDTRRARVMAEALEAGATVINDVTALAGDAESLSVAAEAAAPVILMHMQGEPRTMQQEPRYADAALDVYDWLAERIAACEAAGIPRVRLAIDPGIGFGKTLEHNLQILDSLALFHGLGCAIVLGVSRKSFIGRLSGAEQPKQRVPGSLAAALAGLERGVQIVRVHDVAETVQAFDIWRAIAMAPHNGPGHNELKKTA